MIKKFFVKNYILIFIIALASFLRLYQLNFQSLWDDEIVTMLESNPERSFNNGYDIYLVYDNVPPLYMLVLKYVFMVLGYSSFVLRLFSAVFGIGSVIAIYLFSKELYNKNAGYFAAVLLSVNYFNIYYSQEGRPYAFFIFFTILSFYRLVIYVKNPNLKNALYYGVFTLLMLYGQYYGLFTLLAQILILIYFFIFSPLTKRLYFFKDILIAFCIVIIGYLPATPKLFENAEIKSSWIPLPAADIFKSFFYEFYGNSELVIPFVYILMILFFIKLVTGDKQDNLKNNLQLNPIALSVFILLIWMSVYMLVPLIRSYLIAPMLIPRYYSPLVAAICVMGGIGLAGIKDKWSGVIFTFLFIAFSIVDLIFIRNYYHTLTKTQYSQCADFIKSETKLNEDFISSFAWHYQYFFKKEPLKIKPHLLSLEDYVSKLKSDTLNVKSFWYSCVNEKSVNLSAETNEFLKKNYIIDKRKELFRTNAIHFSKKKNSDLILELSEFSPVKPDESGILFLDGSTAIRHSKIYLNQGHYKMFVCAISMPEKPIDNTNAHLSLYVNGNKAKDCYINNSSSFLDNVIHFNIEKNDSVLIELLMDNDVYKQGLDRNMKIASLRIRKSDEE